ncbi:MAG: DNA-binding response regulator [Oscillatoriales cyanobacterium]|nr:MAG: DNA-binding response regulator [Oscillatoriales cyanobacterium]
MDRHSDRQSDRTSPIEPAKILLVDDERELSDPLSRLLVREGYCVDTAADGRSGYELATGTTYDLLILDWMLPELSGVDLCQQLRQGGQTVPVLFLTAKDTIDDRVSGLDAGADDYLVKPFELRELLARVRALLRRPRASGEGDTNPDPTRGDYLRWDDLSLDCDNQLAYRGDRSIELSDKETCLLAYLMRHPGQVLTHEQISAHLWPVGDRPSSNALAAQIRLLRRKIEAVGEPPMIYSVYGKGYRFGVTPLA